MDRAIDFIYISLKSCQANLILSDNYFCFVRILIDINYLIYSSDTLFYTCKKDEMADPVPTVFHIDATYSGCYDSEAFVVVDYNWIIGTPSSVQLAP